MQGGVSQNVTPRRAGNIELRLEGLCIADELIE
jgi:hypothetical protein